MSYEIYYDKRFLKIGDKICPVVQSGANNCFEVAYPRDIPEKNWWVMNYPNRDQLLFDPKELEELYKTDPYTKESHHKSRYRLHDDFSKWLLAGIKNATTLEEQDGLNNTICLVGYKKREDDYGRDAESRTFKTEEEFHNIHQSLIDEGFVDITVKFKYREINKPRRKRKEKKIINWDQLDKYFVLKSNHPYSRYFSKLLKYGYRYTVHVSHSNKKFKREKDAEKYLEKYKSRLSEFSVYKVENKKEEKERMRA